MNREQAETFEYIIADYTSRLVKLQTPWKDALAAVAQIMPDSPDAESIHLASTIEEDCLLPAQTVIVRYAGGACTSLSPSGQVRLKHAQAKIWKAAPDDLRQASYTLRAEVFRQRPQNDALHAVYKDIQFPFLRSCVERDLFDAVHLPITAGLFDFEGNQLSATLYMPR